ncbi:MAG: urease accessory protein UreD, partial [Roseobacter sp.]
AILLAAPDAERHLPSMRACLPQSCGVSLIRDGLLFARLLAEDGHALRQILIPALRILRGGDLPRTWML